MTESEDKTVMECYRPYMVCPHCDSRDFRVEHDAQGREVCVCQGEVCTFEGDFTDWAADLVNNAPMMFEACGNMLRAWANPNKNLTKAIQGLDRAYHLSRGEDPEGQ